MIIEGDLEDWSEEFSEERAYGIQKNLEGAHYRREQREPWADQKQCYATTPRGFPHRKSGTKSRTFEGDIGRIYVAETPTQVVPHGPKKETSSPDSQTDSAEKKLKKKNTQQIPVFYSS